MFANLPHNCQKHPLLYNHHPQRSILSDCNSFYFNYNWQLFLCVQRYCPRRPTRENQYFFWFFPFQELLTFESNERQMKLKRILPEWGVKFLHLQILNPILDSDFTTMAELKSELNYIMSIMTRTRPRTRTRQIFSCCSQKKN